MKNINVDEFMGDLMQQVYIKKFQAGATSEIKRPTFKLKDQQKDGEKTNGGKDKKQCCIK